MASIEQKTALITGGMGGIGSEIAKVLANENIKIAVTYNKGGDHQVAENWRKKLLQQGFDFQVFFADLSNFDSTKQMIESVLKSFGKIDILVNNAGVTQDSSLIKMNPEQWKTVIETNLNSIFNVTRNVVQSMIDHQYGRIINISSINGQKGQFGQTNYCASKAGIHGFTKALAYELAKKGITVNTISPGYVNTPMVAKMDQAILDKIISQIPVGRLAKPQEIARVVEFLASEDSSYITGANISINGGQHMY